jgi:hypothetical protein
MATRFHWSLYWGAVIGAALLLVGAGVVLGRITAPTPDPIVRTEVRDCQEIAPALQAERARLATLEDAEANAAALAAGLDDVALTLDTDQILDHTKAVDDANRKVQDLRLQLATEMATLDAAVGACAPERDS